MSFSEAYIWTDIVLSKYGKPLEASLWYQLRRTEKYHFPFQNPHAHFKKPCGVADMFQCIKRCQLYGFKGKQQQPNKSSLAFGKIVTDQKRWREWRIHEALVNESFHWDVMGNGCALSVWVPSVWPVKLCTPPVHTTSHNLQIPDHPERLCPSPSPHCLILYWALLDLYCLLRSLIPSSPLSSG